MAHQEEEADAETRAELTVFSVKECYVYQIPPAATAGHRAETWNVDAWLQAVALSVVTCGEGCYVRLCDMTSGELFAECPIPTSAPLITAVEPVVDSSRYFVLRVADRQTKRHAFIGIGFRERMQASDFNASLHEHLQYLSRLRQAAQRQAAYAAAAQRRSSEGGATSSAQEEPADWPQTDFALKPGETIKLKMSTKAAGAGPASRGSALAGAVAHLSPMSPAPGLEIPKLQQPTPGSHIPLLSPPPAKLSTRLSAGASPSANLRVSDEIPRPSPHTQPQQSPPPSSTESWEEGRTADSLQAPLKDLNVRTLESQGADQKPGEASVKLPGQGLADRTPDGGDEEDGDWGHFVG